MTDDCVTQPTGNAGSRLAQCVVSIANTTSNNNVAIADNSQNTIANCLLQQVGSSGISGTVYFSQSNGVTSVTASLNGINTYVSARGIHILQFGDLSSLNGKSAGVHFNPTNSLHAVPPTSNRHLGDLGNVQFTDTSGISWYFSNFSSISLSGPNNIIGRAVAITSSPDDGCTQPDGNSGTIVSICSIGISNPSTSVPKVPSGIPAQSQPKCGILNSNGSALIVGLIFGIGMGIIALGVVIAVYIRHRANKGNEKSVNIDHPKD